MADIEAIENGERSFGTSFVAEARELPLSFGSDAKWYDSKTASTLGGRGWYALVRYTWHDICWDEPQKRFETVAGPFVTEDAAKRAALDARASVAERLGK